MGRSQTSSPLTRVLHRGIHCHPHCMPSLRMHCYRSCMQGTTWKASLARGILALLYADDLVGIAFTADGLQSDIIDPCFEYARRHRYRANVPKCGVMVCGPAVVVQACPQGPSLGGKRRSPECFSISTLGVIVTPDGRQDTHIKQVITQGKCARIADGEATARQAPFGARQAYARLDCTTSIA